MDFGIDAHVADARGDQVRVLAAEIKDYELLHRPVKVENKVARLRML
jgi:hypothetical protein